MKLSKSTTTDEFVIAAQRFHNKKYCYDEFIYHGRNIKSIIICGKHGKFKQSPDCHLRRGQGCPQCGREKIRAINPGKSSEKFKEEAFKKHGDKYNYSKVEYVNNHHKVILICPIHGDFKQSPTNHLKGQGCPKCAISLRNSKLRKPATSFISDAIMIHGSRYEYDHNKYIDNRTKIIIKCPEHGEFEQLPNSHLNGRGCPICSADKISESLKMTYSEFLDRATSVHDNKYKYDKNSFSSAKDKVNVFCPKHGSFYITATYHLAGYGCPRCNCSKGQLQLEQDLRKIYNGNIVCNDRNIISPLELDIVLPEVKLAIEYHGLYWHSYNTIETQKEKNRHLEKLLLAEENSYRLLQIYESEYQNNKPIINSIIANILGKSKRIYARKCEAVRLTNKQRKMFFEANHIQRDRSAYISFGLIYDHNIVAAISFSRHVKYEFEVIRFANIINHSVVGGLAKLLQTFYRAFRPNRIFSYSDRRLFNSVGYQSVGFKHIGYTAPGYKYVKNQQLLSRQAFQKHKLKDKLPIFDHNLSEAENMFRCGYRRIWDCGNHKLLLERI